MEDQEQPKKISESELEAIVIKKVDEYLKVYIEIKCRPILDKYNHLQALKDKLFQKSINLQAQVVGVCKAMEIIQRNSNNPLIPEKPLPELKFCRSVGLQVNTELSKFDNYAPSNNPTVRLPKSKATMTKFGNGSIALPAKSTPISAPFSEIRSRIRGTHIPSTIGGKRINRPSISVSELRNLVQGEAEQLKVPRFMDNLEVAADESPDVEKQQGTHKNINNGNRNKQIQAQKTNEWHTRGFVALTDSRYLKHLELSESSEFDTEVGQGNLDAVMGQQKQQIQINVGVNIQGQEQDAKDYGTTPAELIDLTAYNDSDSESTSSNVTINQDGVKNSWFNNSQIACHDHTYHLTSKSSRRETEQIVLQPGKESSRQNCPTWLLAPTVNSASTSSAEFTQQQSIFMEPTVNCLTPSTSSSGGTNGNGDKNHQDVEKVYVRDAIPITRVQMSESFILPILPAPDIPENQPKGRVVKDKPPIPELTVQERTKGGIILSWTHKISKNHAEIENYQIYCCQEQLTTNVEEERLPPVWKYAGTIKALPLPMACILSQFVTGNRYHFAVRGLDVYNRCGAFCGIVSIALKKP